MSKSYAEVASFLKFHFRHFNAAALVDAAQGWCDHLAAGNRMFLTMAGAMSTAELGLSLADMIRAGKIHGICCTGANLEEDVFNLVAHDSYRKIPQWRSLSAQDEWELAAQGLNRVTDTCIPEEEAMRCIEGTILGHWCAADRAGERFLPHEFFYKMLLSGELTSSYQIDPSHSWLLAAAECQLSLFVPGWEDSTLGNMFVAHVLKGDIKNPTTVRSGLEYMQSLVSWYMEVTREASLGFFQIGGGIAGDFPICAVPLIRQDLGLECPLWRYFCQISDATTSYGSYSGAVPNEKITWGKLDVASPKFLIESDATIVAPLVFAYVLSDEGKETPERTGSSCRKP